MARKIETIVIQDEGRDKGKNFVITEMPASKAEKWGLRALLALSRSGIDIPDDVINSGMAGIAAMGINSLTQLNFFEAEPLMDEMWGCVKFVPDQSRPTVMRALIEDDIEEVATRVSLRVSILELHLNFSTPGVQSKDMKATTAGADLQSILTSPALSEPSSHQVRRRSPNAMKNTA